MSKVPPLVMPEWQELNLDGFLAAGREVIEEADFTPVDRWREREGKVIGHFQVYFPEEIAHAAGLLPLKIRGAPLDSRQADSHFGSYLCSILKSSLELALTGRVQLEMFVTHPICDAARNLAAVWGRNVDYPCQILYLPQNANSPHAVEYLRHEYDRLKRAMEDIAESKVSPENLNRSLEIYNENRRLLRELYALRRERPWLLAVDEAYILMVIGSILPREEHNQLLRRLLPQIEARSAKPQDRIRVIFEGGFCEQPPLDLLRVVGRSCYVVDDDLMIGMRWILDDVSLDGDPLRNLAHAYLEQSSYSPVQHDLRKPKEEMLVRRVEGASAEAAILGAAKMCEPGLDEQVAYSTALEAENLPYFITEFEENMTSFDQVEIQIETFSENILFYQEPSSAT